MRAPDEPRLDAERVLVFDDVKLDRAGQIEPLGGIIETTMVVRAVLCW